VKFDLRTVVGAKKFLFDWLGIDDISVMNYLKCNNQGIDVDDFCEQLGVSLNEYEVNNITYVASHVTTCIDDLGSIKEYGLMDLTSVLTLPTPLKQFLRSYGIEFDVKNGIMKVEDKSYDVSYNKDSQNGFIDRESLIGRLKAIGHKLYFDNQISSFFTMEGDKEYGGYVHLRPEFLFNVSNVCEKDLEHDWISRSKAYVLEYEEEFENFEWFTFYESKYEYLNDFFDKVNHRRWLISKSLYRLWNDYVYDDITEEYAYVKPSYIIPWKNIIGIREIV
jgi:hypothetical protein